MDSESGIPLARDGLPLIGTSLGAALLLWLGASLSDGVLSSVLGALTIAAFVLAVLLVNFFRDPQRLPPAGSGLVVAPADGRVLIVDADVEESRFLHARTAKVSIFMSPLDVHVNRAPIDGEVVGVHYNAGKYFAAFSEKSSLDNEQNAVVMRANDGRMVLFIQIAGFLARRIVCRIAPGERCTRGQRVGMIKLGSRVDVFVPGPFKIMVKRGDRVTAGETVLGVLS